MSVVLALYERDNNSMICQHEPIHLFAITQEAP